MKITLRLVLLLAFGLSSSLGDIAGVWSSVTFKVAHPNGEAVVSIDGLESLTRITLVLREKKFEVPKAEFEGIELPQLRTAQLIFGAFDPQVRDGTPKPYYSLDMRFDGKEHFGEYPLVSFLFHDGKCQKRTETIRTSTNTWQDYEKSVGAERTVGGTITRLTHKETKKDRGSKSAPRPKGK